MPCYQEIVCPECGSSQITNPAVPSKEHNVTGHIEGCSIKTFLLDYRYKSYVPGVKRQVVEMVINGSGIRDTGRVVGGINKNTVISTLKKANHTSTGKPCC